jgi:hypothetical protein
MTNPLSYKRTSVPEGAVMNFSPSRFAEFITHPHRWFQSQVMDVSSFDYNTSSVLGTIVHYCAEMVAKGEEVNQKMIDEYIKMHEPKEDYDPSIVNGQYVLMAEELVNSYVLRNEYLEIEIKHQAEIKNGYYAGGTLDATQGCKEDCMVVDYKTYNSKTVPKTIPPHYKYQLLVYAWVLTKKGYNPTRIRLVYVNRNIDGGVSDKTGKPLKSYPPAVTVITEVLTAEDMDFINGLLELAVDSVEAWEKYPELAHVIWHDPRLAKE